MTPRLVARGRPQLVRTRAPSGGHAANRRSSSRSRCRGEIGWTSSTRCRRYSMVSTCTSRSSGRSMDSTSSAVWSTCASRRRSLTDLAVSSRADLLINRLRDAHTQYVGPWTVERRSRACRSWSRLRFGRATATTSCRKSTAGSINDRHFVEGVTITYWNGVPFDRAVELHAEAKPVDVPMRGGRAPSTR